MFIFWILFIFMYCMYDMYVCMYVCMYVRIIMDSSSTRVV